MAWPAVHSVQFYESEPFLHRGIRSFLAPALHDGHPCVMVARRRTFDGVVDGLTSARGRPPAIRFLDAETTLAGIMDGSCPDPVRFEAGLSRLFEDLVPGGCGAIRVYGEMVDLLCAAGDHGAALALEQCWERFLGEQPVALMCGYSLAHLGDDDEARHVRTICLHHTHVLATEAATRTIYVIDDDHSVRRSLARLLGVQGGRVKTFASAEEFLVEAAEDADGCLVLDLRLLGMSGLDLQRLLAMSGRRIPVIAISASADPRLAEETMRQGARAFLPKPIDAGALVAEVVSALSERARPGRS